MLIEYWAYNNRWRWVHPAAKGLVTLSAFVSAFVAATPWFLLALTLALAMLTIWGAGIPWRYYLRVFLPPLTFLVISAATLLIAVDGPATSWPLSWRWEPAQFPLVALICGRSLACLAALLLLALTTPMTDLITLLRRLRTPAILVELMTLGYRTIFVLLAAVHDITTAQKARLGYASLAAARRSFGMMIAVLAIQVWQRAAALSMAAAARGGDGPLRFLDHDFSPRRHDLLIAASFSSVLLFTAILVRYAGS